MSRKNYDLSILIPARNEMFLKNTVEDILKNKRGATEIIVGLDGEWANPPIKNHEDVTIVYVKESWGQRGMTNQLCKLSRAKYVAKCDAHCAFDEGFDVKLLEGFKETGDNVVVVPKMYNLHVFDWKCPQCGKKTYQGRTPLKCEDCGNTKGFYRKIVWKPRPSRHTESWMFDSTLHFQYWPEYKTREDFKNPISETMSLIGAFWMVSREKYWELNICDENHGSWGQQGTEIACKIWLSGGRLLCNKNTWFAHMFRTQGGDFGFPFPNPQHAVEKARQYSRDMWYNNKFEKQVRPLSWLVEHFWPILPVKDKHPGWTKEDLIKQKQREINFK